MAENPSQSDTPGEETPSSPTPPLDAADPDTEGDAEANVDAEVAGEGGHTAEDLANDALRAAQEAVESLSASSDFGSEAEPAATTTVAAAPVPDDAEARPVDLPGLATNGEAHDASGISLLSDVDLRVKVELGRTRMYVEDVLRLNEGSVVELDKLAGDPVDIYVNDRHVARGEVLVVNDTFCVRVSEIIQTQVAED